jgi:SAM-dependent methyltransferase
LSLKAKIYDLRRHPTLLKYILVRAKWEKIEDKCKSMDDKEVFDFISVLKQNSSYHVNLNENKKLNTLCNVEDWKNPEIINALSELQKLDPRGYIHRKDWEWALGIIAMNRLGKLNKHSTAIGVGSGTEPIPFYLSNMIRHVYATDLYIENESWKRAAPSDFPENPKKYAPFPYKEDALTISRMSGTNLEFPSDSFDIAFSFSSIEHFGGKNHSGALKSLKEIERVLKPGGIAVIATEYIINNKSHPEFFNDTTIYSDLIDNLRKLKLVEPINTNLTTKTLDTVLDFFSIDVNWDNMDDDFKKNHPLILLKVRNILFTSLMLVFQKS